MTSNPDTRPASMLQRTLPTDNPSLATPPDTPGTWPEAFRFFWTHWSPRLLAAAALAGLAGRLWLGDFRAVDALIVAAVVALWPMLEWLIHVFILHFKPKTLFGREIDFFNAKKHRAHHRDPWRTEITFIPLRAVITGLVVAPALWLLALPTAQAFTGVAIFFLLSLNYEWVHYVCHVRYRPALKYYRRLVDSHRLHHFKSEKHWLGVSMLMGDRIMGTSPDPKAISKSSTVRTLGVT